MTLSAMEGFPFFILDSKSGLIYILSSNRSLKKDHRLPFLKVLAEAAYSVYDSFLRISEALSQ